MIALPAIDLRDGACVQLVGGEYAAERVRLPDPLAVADRWRRAGFAELHVVDLDAATGRGDNLEIVAELAAGGVDAGLVVQVGGGVRDERRIERLVDAGADRVVVGTRALEDPAWLRRVAVAFPGRIVLAADVRNRDVVVAGWSRPTGRSIEEVLRDVLDLPLAGVLVTAVHVEGRMEGPDLALVRDVVAAAAAIPVQASGGVARLEDLRALDAAGAGRAVIGMALYTGLLDPEAAAKEFGR